MCARSVAPDCASAKRFEMQTVRLGHDAQLGLRNARTGSERVASAERALEGRVQ